MTSRKNIVAFDINQPPEVSIPVKVENRLKRRRSVLGAIGIFDGAQDKLAGKTLAGIFD